MRPSAWKNSAPTGRIFMKFGIWVLFENGSRITGTLLEDKFTFLSYLARIFLEWENFHTKVVEKIKTHFFVFDIFFSKLLSFLE